MKTNPAEPAHNRLALFLVGVGLMVLAFFGLFEAGPNASTFQSGLAVCVFLLGLALAGFYGFLAFVRWTDSARQCHHLEEQNDALRQQSESRFTTN